jgi:hypothetical protein
MELQYNSLGITRAMKSGIRWVGRIARVREARNAYKSSVRKPENRRQIWRLGCRWESYYKLNLKKLGMDLIHGAQDRD